MVKIDVDQLQPAIARGRGYSAGRGGHFFACAPAIVTNVRFNQGRLPQRALR
jgi:hypothetical protein